MPPWRLARSLTDLRDQADEAVPNRSKASDGTIGDTRHQNEGGGSRHNPNAAGVVTAFDLTHDPAHGMDTFVYCRNLAAHPEVIPNDLAYLISNRQIASREAGWTWRPYTGTDPHTNHAHFGVGRGPDSAPVGPYDDTSFWHFDTLLTDTQEDWMGDPYNRNEVVGPLDKIAAAVDQSILPTLVFISQHLGIDPKDLASKLAPLISAQVTHLDDADLKAVAKAVADEQAARLKD